MIHLIRQIRILEDGWLPIAPTILTALGWREGDMIQLEVIEGAILITKPEKEEK